MASEGSEASLAGSDMAGRGVAPRPRNLARELLGGAEAADVPQSEHVTRKKLSVRSTVREEGRQMRQVVQEEAVRVERTVRVITSDYSSQSDTEQGGTPRTPHNTSAALLRARTESPRLRAWEGEDWVTSPRTGYTYGASLTYRSSVTPGRTIPMPHMARPPLWGRGHWSLADLSEDDEARSPIRIFRRAPAEAGAGLLDWRRLQTLLSRLLLPLTCLLGVARLGLSKLVSDPPSLACLATAVHSIGRHCTTLTAAVLQWSLQSCYYLTSSLALLCGLI